jgi:hypothetical protein
MAAGIPIHRGSQNREVMMRTRQALTRTVVVLLAFVGVSCAGSATKQSDFDVFLNRLAQDCKPLIIGSDNFGQAIVFQGLGAQPENYNNFLGKTQALYSGAIPPEIYRDSLTAFIGSGTYNDRSFNCIIAHLPKK